MRAEPTLSQDNNSGSLAGEGHGGYLMRRKAVDQKKLCAKPEDGPATG